VQLHLGVENLDERIEIPLVESPDELSDGVGDQSISRSRTAAKSKQVGGRRERGEGSALRA
jgi:hypothetical protein